VQTAPPVATRPRAERANREAGCCDAGSSGGVQHSERFNLSAAVSSSRDASDYLPYGVVILNVSNTLVVALVPLVRLVTVALP
jgi:hypothetical protein